MASSSPSHVLAYFLAFAAVLAALAAVTKTRFGNLRQPAALNDREEMLRDPDGDLCTSHYVEFARK